MTSKRLKPTFAELETPFSCGWTKSPHDDVGWETREFSTLEDAEALYQKKEGTSELYAYLGEIGIWESTGGKLELDWLTFRTNNPEWLEKSKERADARKKDDCKWGRPLSKEDAGYLPYKSLAQLRNL
ncbi:hypothetical protein [Paracoccus contaminans]|uniref:hypothetical protein n=1 Tax=Paracoccus contaminans TaxID=1945662 RepID=UPI0012F51963|nr:hypothetical protein [Paracoccus contaminans]